MPPTKWWYVDDIWLYHISLYIMLLFFNIIFSIYCYMEYSIMYSFISLVNGRKTHISLAKVSGIAAGTPRSGTGNASVWQPRWLWCHQTDLANSGWTFGLDKTLVFTRVKKTNITAGALPCIFHIFSIEFDSYIVLNHLTMGHCNNHFHTVLEASGGKCPIAGFHVGIKHVISHWLVFPSSLMIKH